MSFEKGQVVQHGERLGVVISNIWWPDAKRGNFLHGVLWVTGDPTYITPDVLIPRDDIAITDFEKGRE